jgi:transcriptional regulator with XRE-family HTH domain
MPEHPHTTGRHRTPFGERVHALRAARGMTLSQLAAELGVSPAYLSALEHGQRGRPSWWLVQRIIAVFNIIWDEAEELIELARLSHPRPVLDTRGLSPRATLLANRLAERIHRLSDEQVRRLLEILEETERDRAASHAKEP